MKWIFLLLLNPSFPAPATDWAFQEAQERFVFDCDPKAAVDSLPKYSRQLLEMMATRDFVQRDWASKEMLKLADKRACFVGQWGGDPEVRLRCRNILRRLSACQMCGGAGGKDESIYRIECQSCLAVGHFYPIDDFE
jgi:hypothetical protein